MIRSQLDPRLWPASWRILATGYVVLEAVLGGLAFSSDQARPGVEVAAFVLALPAMVVAIPVIYVIGALAWSTRDLLAGHPMWPVTATFALLFAVTAIANVVLVRLLCMARGRARRDELPRSEVSPQLR